jgi:hypothetical protein
MLIYAFFQIARNAGLQHAVVAISQNVDAILCSHISVSHCEKYSLIFAQGIASPACQRGRNDNPHHVIARNEMTKQSPKRRLHDDAPPAAQRYLSDGKGIASAIEKLHDETIL